MQFLILRPFRKDNIYFRTIEERGEINMSILPATIFRKCLEYAGIDLRELASVSTGIVSEFVFYCRSKRGSGEEN